MWKVSDRGDDSNFAARTETAPMIPWGGGGAK